MIYKLSTNPNSKFKGWCYASKIHLSEEIGLTKQGILKMIERLISSGFIKKQDKTKFLRTTNKWNIVYFEDGKLSSSSGKQSLPENGKQSLPNNNTIIIDSNNKLELDFPTVVKKKKSLDPPTKDDVIKYFLSKGYNKEIAEKFWDGYDVADWKDSQGNKVKNWKQKAIHVWFKPEHKIKSTDGGFDIKNYTS